MGKGAADQLASEWASRLRHRAIGSGAGPPGWLGSRCGRPAPLKLRQLGCQFEMRRPPRPLQWPTSRCWPTTPIASCCSPSSERRRRRSRCRRLGRTRRYIAAPVHPALPTHPNALCAGTVTSGSSTSALRPPSGRVRLNGRFPGGGCGGMCTVCRTHRRPPLLPTAAVWVHWSAHGGGLSRRHSCRWGRPRPPGTAQPASC